MRQLSPSMLKGRSKVSEGIPEPGSKVRFVYDFLYENRGRLIPSPELRALAELVAPSKQSGRLRNHALINIIICLQDYWGCDIRSVPGQRLSYHLVGEWCGKVYVDYTRQAERAA